MGMVASANYFDVLGVRPIAWARLSARGGREAGRRARGGDQLPAVANAFRRESRTSWASTIEINEHPYTIVGVTPAVFQGSQTGVRTEIWVPIMMEEQVTPQGDLLHDHHYFWLLAFGRLKPGVTLEQAQAEMTLRLKPEAKNYPEEHRGKDTVTVYPLWRNPFGLNLFLSIPAAGADEHRGPGAAAGMHERGESDAGEVGGAAA